MSKSSQVPGFGSFDATPKDPTRAPPGHRRGAGYTVFDAGTGAVDHRGKGYAPGYLNVSFRRSAADNRPAKLVPMRGDPPPNLAFQRAYAEAGNPGVRVTEHPDTVSLKSPDTAYMDGFDAGHAGISIAACPHPTGWARQQWQLGWRAAESRRVI